MTGQTLVPSDAAGIVAVVDGDAGHQDEQHPEGNVAHDVAGAQAGEREVLQSRGGPVEELVDQGHARGDEAADGLKLFVLFEGEFGAAAAGARGESLDGHGEEEPDGGEAEEADSAPEQTVVKEDTAGGVERPGEEKGVALDDRPVARNGIVEQDADGIEHAGPEEGERAGGLKGGDADEVEHEERGALQIDDEDVAGESGDQEEERAEEEDLHHDDGEEGLQDPREVIGGDAGVIGPGSEGAEKLAEDAVPRKRRRWRRRSRPSDRRDRRIWRWAW